MLQILSKNKTESPKVFGKTLSAPENLSSSFKNQTQVPSRSFQNLPKRKHKGHENLLMSSKAKYKVKKRFNNLKKKKHKKN